MKVLVTGATGFVGRRTMQYLVAHGLEVRAVQRRPVAERTIGVEWVLLPDLLDQSRLQECIAGCEAIVHVAGLAHQAGSAQALISAFRRVNTEGTRVLARLAKRNAVRKIVFISSIAAVCTRSDIPISDQTPTRPTDAYGRSKLEAEQALTAELTDSPVDWCILRPPLLYGPGNPGNMGRLVRLLNSGLPLPLASIRNRRSFMFVDNLADAVWRILTETKALRSAHVISDGSDFSTPELARKLAAMKNTNLRLLPAPVWAIKALGLAGDALSALLGASVGFDSVAADRLTGSLCVDASGFREALSWNPPFAPDFAFQQIGVLPH